MENVVLILMLRRRHLTPTKACYLMVYRLLSFNLLSLDTFPSSWFCAVHMTKGIMLKTQDLEMAQKALNTVGNFYNQQAVIPMTKSHAGNPEHLPRTWPGGSAYWYNWPKINIMREICSRGSVPIFNIGYPRFLF